MPAKAIPQKKSLQVDVNEQIECAQTLASRFYTDASILEIVRRENGVHHFHMLLREFLERT